MAVPACAKCGQHSFERGFITPVGDQRAIPVLQCASCGTVIAALDALSMVAGLQRQVAAIDAGLVRIAKALSES
jgi:uncharacterized Zn finger protein